MIPRSKTNDKPIRPARQKKKPKNRKRVARPRLDPARIYTRAEAALTVGCSELTLHRARDAGFLEELRAGYRVLHSGEQLIRWLQAGGKTGYSSRNSEAQSKDKNFPETA